MVKRTFNIYSSNKACQVLSGSAAGTHQIAQNFMQSSIFLLWRTLELNWGIKQINVNGTKLVVSEREVKTSSVANKVWVETTRMRTQQRLFPDIKQGQQFL